MKTYSELYLVADEHVETIRDERDEGEEYDPYGFIEDEVTLDVHGLQLVGEIEVKDSYEPYPDSQRVVAPFQVEVGDYLYTVIVRYSSGSTFNHRSGDHCIEGVYRNHDEAKAVAKRIEQGEYSDDITPWTGFFERLERVEIHELRVRQ